MPFTLLFQGWKTLNYITSFSMMRLDTVLREYEVLLVSDMKLNRVRRKFESG